MTDATDATDRTDEYPSDVQELLSDALSVHGQLSAAQAQVDALLAARRAKVIRLRARGLSGYELAKLFHVSQTTIGNWTN